MAIRGTAVIDVEKDFSWGPRVATYVVEHILIIAYHPQIFKKSCGTGRYSRKVNYHVYLHTDAYKRTPLIDDRARWQMKEGWDDTNHSFHTIEEALAGAIAYLYDGCNTRADRYFMRAIGGVK